MRDLEEIVNKLDLLIGRDLGDEFSFKLQNLSINRGEFWLVFSLLSVVLRKI